MKYSDSKIIQLLCDYPYLDLIYLNGMGCAISKIWLASDLSGYIYLNRKEFGLYNSDGIQYKVIKIHQEPYEFLKLKLL